MEEKAGLLGDLLSFAGEDRRFWLECQGGKLIVEVISDGILRIKGDKEGLFPDKGEGKILAYKEEELYAAFTPSELRVDETPESIRIATPHFWLVINRHPCTFEAYRPDGRLYFKESSPMIIGEKETVQSFCGDKDEYFFGGGMQNGYFSHKGRSIDIELKVSHWNAGSVSNPAPFYMSSFGYGQFRNTFANATYSFLEETTLTQKEEFLDAFYFFGKDMAEVLDLYTKLTGRPHLIPRWGMLPGDANCYKDTMDAFKVVEGYVANDIPRGWILPNDGYGCGYTDLKGFISGAERFGFKVGLWTENAMDKLAAEVSDYGSRAVKTDVAWVGPGYAFALDGVKVCHEGIENNSDARSYLWTCCGWAGTQRYSTIWSGDQFGNWEYIRMHIPTYIGSGLSGNPYPGSDVDGIFAGSAATHVRDLQWKCFTPILIQMSGWAEKNKQAWVWGEPYTSWNRDYLKLKLRLLPYMYSHAYRSSKDATPILRPMFWDFPGEKYSYTNETQYQFMAGESFLVAPVFEDTDVRDAIYMPDENQWWIDYHTGEQYQGGRVLNSFKAPLEKLPVFVKSGSIIPMYPEGRFDGDVLPDEKHPLTLDIYPGGEISFIMYEDDGSTKEYRRGRNALTRINASSPKDSAGTLTVEVSPLEGGYKGIKDKRRYEFCVHSKCNPGSITVNGEAVVVVSDRDSYNKAEGFSAFYDGDLVGGVVFIKTPAYSISEGVKATVENVDNLPKIIPVTESLPVPENLRCAEYFDTKLSVEWDTAEGAEWYDLEIDGVIFTHVSNPYCHRELSFTTDYTYRVRACGTGKQSAWSEAVTLTTLESFLKEALGENEMTVSATSVRPGYDPEKAVNGDGESMWLSESKGETDLPCTFTMAFKDAYYIDRFDYRSRPKGARGNITKYDLEVGIDGIHYKKLVAEGNWEDSDDTHTVKFPGELVQYMRITALEGNKNYANAIHLMPFRVKDTQPALAGNYTGGDRVDDNDLTFLKNYVGVFREDNDWGYVAKADVNYNGMIDAYDLAFVASKLSGGISSAAEGSYAEDPAGRIVLDFDKESVKAGETFKITVKGEGLKNLYAFHMILPMTENFEHTSCTGRRCGQAVTASSGDLTQEMINASALKSDENGSKLIVAFSGRGVIEAVCGDGELANFNLVAKTDIPDLKSGVKPLSVMTVGLSKGALSVNEQ